MLSWRVKPGKDHDRRDEVGEMQRVEGSSGDDDGEDESVAVEEAVRRRCLRPAPLAILRLPLFTRNQLYIEVNSKYFCLACISACIFFFIQAMYNESKNAMIRIAQCTIQISNCSTNQLPRKCLKNESNLIQAKKKREIQAPNPLWIFSINVQIPQSNAHTVSYQSMSSFMKS